MKKQLEVMEEKEVCNDFIFAVAFVVVSNYVLTSSHLLCVYAQRVKELEDENEMLKEKVQVLEESSRVSRDEF